MALKKNGLEPTFSLVVAQCPNATINAGKSLLAAAVLEKVAVELGMQVPDTADRPFVEVTVEGDADLDFSEFDHRAHAGVLLDGVGDTLTLWRNREVLQGRPKVLRGGRSATMVYSYPYTLARRAIVATMDLTAKNLHLLKTNHWLKDPRNVCLLELTSPAWTPDGRAQADGQPDPSPREQMLSWTVHEVQEFFDKGDAAGLGVTLHANAVNGADLLSCGHASELVKALCMTPFAAKKVLQLRDQFLS